MAEQEQELGQELGLCFQRRFLAARQLRGFPWPELEQRLRSAPGSSLLADILHQVRAGLSLELLILSNQNLKGRRQKGRTTNSQN
uniref:FAM86 N-terminal domain-containing protein n=1 Tax=Anas platyrhynchos platyrhynchos TaxID=8840 RepID=A0A493THX2_ANAPP